MTKEKFEQYEGLLHCKSCNHDVPKMHMYYKKVYADGSIARCNVCEWIKRHNGLPNIDNFTKEEILIALYFFIYSESEYINNLACKINRTIEDTIKLFQLLKIKNKKCLVKSKCKYCNKEIVNFPNVFTMRDNLYCSYECYWADKTNTVAHGEDNQFYNRISTSCTNCGKEIKIIPSNYNEINSYGDNHNFCSKICYWKYRSKYYVGEKSNMANYEFTDEQREKARLNMIKYGRSAKRFDSNIQLKINNILDKNNINYEREYVIKYYAIDNYLTDYNLIIEVMGDYWHTSPLKYNAEKYLINEMQQKGILHDKQKHTYIKKYNNIEILYLWETDINNKPNLCEKLILDYIKNNGILQNYHSFNWDLKDNNLILHKDLIIPYQDMKTNEYEHIIKKKAG